jgi:RNA polymerase sigma-70 factor (ECF subfamily)
MTERSQAGGWVDAARRGDRLALAKLLAACHPRLRARADARMSPALKARGGPDDILQEVYLQVFRQIARFEHRGPDSFLNWVYTILDRKLIDAERAAHRQVRDVGREVPAGVAAASSSYWNLLDRLQADSATPSRVVRREEALGALLACLGGLSKAHQEVIRLRFLEGRSVDEVAAQLGKSKGAVIALSKRALEALRVSMDRIGEFTRGG